MGTPFRGFQSQIKGKTVQDEILKALKKISLNPNFTGCSRTDSGVHARIFYGHTIQKDVNRSFKEILKGLNTYLPQEIKIFGINEVCEDFHSRYSVSEKTYRYFFSFKDVLPPPIVPFITMLKGVVDENKLEEPLKIFKGEHDFKAYTTSEGRKVNTIRCLSKLTLLKFEEIYCIEIKGKSFLHRMVRFIVGAIIHFARGKIDKLFLKRSLSGEIEHLPFPALPSNGLHLWDVRYEDLEIKGGYEEDYLFSLYPFENLPFYVISES